MCQGHQTVYVHRQVVYWINRVATVVQICAVNWIGEFHGLPAEFHCFRLGAVLLFHRRKKNCLKAHLGWGKCQVVEINGMVRHRRDGNHLRG